MPTKTEATEERGLIIHSAQVPSEYEGLEFEPDGNEDIPPSWPVIRIVQATSKMEGGKKHVGQFWHSDRAEDNPQNIDAGYTPELFAVVLQKQNTRALFEDDAEQPSCSSTDGIMPRPGGALWTKETVILGKVKTPVPEKAPTLCSGCPFSEWGADGTPPPCGESFSLLVLRQDDGKLAMMRLGGTSIGPYRAEIKKLRRRNLPVYTQSMRMWTEEKKATGKNWMQLVIEMEPLPRADVQAVIGLIKENRQGFADTVERTIERDEAPARAVNDDDWGNGSDTVPPRQAAAWDDAN